jgi:hypothetical protein
MELKVETKARNTKYECRLCHVPLLQPSAELRALHVCYNFKGSTNKKRSPPPLPAPKKRKREPSSLPPKKRPRIQPQPTTQQEEYQVASIDDHRLNPVTNEWEFHVMWLCDNPKDPNKDTWEPAKQFMDVDPKGNWVNVNELFARYLLEKRPSEKIEQELVIDLDDDVMTPNECH